jgi:hypothetical protein
MAGYSGSIPVTGFIAPADTSDSYAVIDPLYGIDGLRNVPTVADLHTIPASRRRAGMVVGIQLTGAYYKLLNIPWNYDITDWTDFITAPVPGNIPRTQFVVTGGTVSIPAYYQYYIYGGLTIGASGSVINDGQIIIDNGTLSFVDNGTYSGTGTITYLTSFARSNSINNFVYTGIGPTMSQPSVKYAASFSSSASVPITITHSLNTQDIVYSVREGNNFITANVEISDENSIFLTTNSDVANGRINIIG